MTNLIVLQIFNGLVLGMIYVLLAMGLSIVWGMMDIINFSHGLFYALGAYLAYSYVQLTGDFWSALLVVPLGTALIGMILERLLLRKLYGENILFQILMTFGLAMIGRELIILGYGPVGKSFTMPHALMGVIKMGSLFFPRYRLFIFLFVIVLTVGMWLLIEKTRYGSIVRAGTENANMVSCLGINISLVFTLIFGLAMAIAGLGGVLAAPMRGVEPFMGDLILGICFAVVVIGGMGSFFGAVVGGLIVGLCQSLITLVLPSASVIIVFVVMAGILLIRPRGLMGIRD
ncbi:branched-chain amino acid ABC transporter permease [Desulfocurvus sp. DL9XJH121]